MTAGLFVAFEGCEGSGKSTQAERLFRRLLELGEKVTMVHEPGTTQLGAYLRDYLKSKRPLTKEAELLLFEAARAQLVADELAPRLREGYVVIADRFAASSLAYQGYGRRIDLEAVRRLNHFATGGLSPGLTVLLDVGPAEGLRRVGEPQLRLALDPGESAEAGRQDLEGHRRFEDAPLTFHTRVRDGYRQMAEADPEGWVTIDASLAEQQVEELVWQAVAPRLPVREDGPDDGPENSPVALNPVPCA